MSEYLKGLIDVSYLWEYVLSTRRAFMMSPAMAQWNRAQEDSLGANTQIGDGAAYIHLRQDDSLASSLTRDIPCIHCIYKMQTASVFS